MPNAKQLCLACAVAPAGPAAVVAASPAASPGPAPAPAPQPADTVGDIRLGLLVTGLSSYTAATQSALVAGVASVANSGAPAASPITAADVTLNASSYAASAALVLQGLGLPQYPQNAAGGLCFERAVSAVAGVPLGAISVRPLASAPQGVEVPFYVYSTSYNEADRFQTAVAGLATPANSAAMVAHLATCGIQCQGVLEANPPALAATLVATVAVAAPDAASQAQVVGAMGHTTAYVVAFRAAGLPTSAAVQITSPPRYVPIPPPPPPHPPKPSPPPLPPAPRGGRHSAAPGRARAAAAGAVVAAAAALAL